ncbi:helix-turn-helix domain-containing protein [Acidovorax sp. LjRoot66]|uniref:helix-turn-helix domain-containing protein n=1 Tax=Acidovorax sp. LjRoot66 TaxID=3342334 RepID=UPI000D7C9CE0
MSSKRRVTNSLPRAIKAIRDVRALSQEDFSLVSSRTYMSTVERGLKSPTLGKLEQIASVMQIHPLTLLVLTYASSASPNAAAEMFDIVQRDVEQLWPRERKV